MDYGKFASDNGPGLRSIPAINNNDMTIKIQINLESQYL